MLCCVAGCYVVSLDVMLCRWMLCCVAGCYVVSLDGQFPMYREMVVPSLSGSNSFGLCLTSCFLRGVNEICILLDWQQTADLLCITLQKKADVSARLLKSGTK